MSASEVETLRAVIDSRLSAGLPPSVRQQRARDLGAGLFSALTADPAVREAFDRARSAADERGRGLRITLYLRAVPELADLPWELLYARPGFLAQSIWTPVVRYLGTEEARTPLPVTGPMRVLAMVSNPSGEHLAAVDAVKERELLEAALDFLISAGRVELHWLKGGTLEELRQEVAYGSDFHVFHFIGHGELQEDGEGGLLLEDKDGRPRAVTGERLGTVLCERRTLRLAVLNACEGARGAAHDALAGVAGGLVERDIPAVVAMQSAITDDAAVTFSHELYRMLLEGHPIDAAVTEGRRALSTQDGLEWAIPVLFMSVSDGRVFDLADIHEVALDLRRPRYSIDALRRADAAGDADAAFDLGVVLGEHGRSEEAEEAYRRADARGHGQAATALGVMYATRGDVHGAIDAYRRALERDQPDAGLNLGILLAGRGNAPDAEAAYARAVELGSSEAAANLGFLRQRRGDIEGAERAFRIGDERGDAIAVNNLGIILLRRDDADGARRCFERASALGSGEGAYNLGVLHTQHGDEPGAEAAFRTADERGDGRAAFNLGVMALKRGDPAASYAAMRRAAERGHPQAMELLTRDRR